MGWGRGHAYSSSTAPLAVMKIKSPCQGMSQKPPDVSSTATLEIGGGGDGRGHPRHPTRPTRRISSSGRPRAAGGGCGGVEKGVRGDRSVSVLPAVTSRREPHLPSLRALLCAQGKG